MRHLIPVRLRRLCLLAGMLLLTSCAALEQAVQPGTPREGVLAAWGPPTATYPLPGGSRLQYSRQPLGREVYNIDLDAQGRVSSYYQALQPAVFAQIGIGQWGTADVLRTFGRPAEVSRVGDFAGDVWTYKYLEFNNPRQFHIYLDAQGIVRRAHPTDEVFDRRMLLMR